MSADGGRSESLHGERDGWRAWQAGIRPVQPYAFNGAEPLPQPRDEFDAALVEIREGSGKTRATCWPLSQRRQEVDAGAGANDALVGEGAGLGELGCRVRRRL